jgi:1,4-alpha-glucan branching enzyme
MQVQEGAAQFDCKFWNPPEKFEWTHPEAVKIPEQSQRIYESHVGMSQEGGYVASYREFADNNLERIKKAGYNVIQLMAIQEHAYYASFGYHVTGFFAISSRSGSPDDFKYLVNKAHSMGLRIIVDLVHSHASTNTADGIKDFDGTDHCFSHSGARGYHSGWDSMLFDYSKYEVKKFLLANLAWFLEEYKVDGFRFDAVTSILYNHHGIGVSFSGNYAEYFGLHTDLEGIVYLMLANCLVRELRPGAITVAEDVSGMPTLCRSLRDGGIGFDYRLSMFMPDMWIKLMKTEDPSWSMGHIAQSLTNRRWKEEVVGYAESHDQAIVGDKTLMMHLLDADVYGGLSKHE